MSRHTTKPAHDAFPVRTVARLTGLSADLIRAWEKRYGVVAPIRGPRGSRLYTARDVAHLRLLAKVVGAGRAIGDVAGLKRSALEALLGDGGERSATSDVAPALLERLIEALERFDLFALDRQLTEALVALGARSFVRGVAAPLLVEVGLRQSDGRLSIADERLISGLMRTLLSGLIRSRRAFDGPSIILATSSGERHEFGLLLVSLLILDAGLVVYYLGGDLPPDDIVSAARRARAAAVGLSFVNAENRVHAVAALRTVERGLPPHTELWIGGRDAAETRAAAGGTRAMVLDDLDLVERETARLRAVTLERR
jgi:DNA-binding transcriptional MerR regulator/methylmalonyl-CoA mutase cobalamin-binding subunit